MSSAREERMGFIEDQIIAEMREIPPERHAEVLKAVQELRRKYAPKRPRKSLKGLWADLNIHLSEEEIDELRRECWSMSPTKNEGV
jgi:hypothetical protein